MQKLLDEFSRNSLEMNHRINFGDLRMIRDYWSNVGINTERILKSMLGGIIEINRRMLIVKLRDMPKKTFGEIL